MNPSGTLRQIPTEPAGVGAGAVAAEADGAANVQTDREMRIAASAAANLVCMVVSLTDRGMTADK